MVEDTEKVEQGDSIRSRIYWNLRKKIRRGEVRSDEKIVDIELARALGVSRMPAREALLQLQNEGYVVGTTRGFALPQLDNRDIADIFEIRRLLEPRAAASAATVLSEEGINKLSAAVDMGETAVAKQDFAGLVSATVQFRETWIASIPNSRLAEFVSRCSDQVQVVRQKNMISRESQLAVMDGLRRLLDAFSRRDVLDVYDQTARFIADGEGHFSRAMKV